LLELILTTKNGHAILLYADATHYLKKFKAEAG